MSLRNKKNLLKNFEKFKDDKLRNDYESIIDSFIPSTLNQNDLKKKLKSELNKSKFNESGFFLGPEKAELQNKLLEEQGYVCIYCQKRVKRKQGAIEHIRPKGIYGKLTYDYFNLAISCKDNSRTCDPKKNNSLLLEYHKCDIEKEIDYNLNGELSSMNENLKEDIKTLGLNEPSLKRKRMLALKGFLYEPFEENGKIKKRLINYTAEELVYISEKLKDKKLGQFHPYYMFISKNLSNIEKIKSMKKRIEIERNISKEILEFLKSNNIDNDIIQSFEKKFIKL
ncbi:MAG: retron system putative HNH endonuclease [Fusobacteriaceae bacterium]